MVTSVREGARRRPRTKGPGRVGARPLVAARAGGPDRGAMVPRAVLVVSVLLAQAGGQPPVGTPSGGLPAASSAAGSGGSTSAPAPTTATPTSTPTPPPNATSTATDAAASPSDASRPSRRDRDRANAAEDTAAPAGVSAPS